ncbi:hypothetical protein BSK66_32315 [Paenibacillus odorifer]|uniref:hypothetical protein n=1 Tax=Paenibacillus TaxID=44249 RepID=UPI0003E1E0EB|nr:MULTISPECIES: hypothetical protein [Paenibacillus]ETT56840.1 hypothetical protein C171_17932 [Paenibacillus sp. FSL H8-237]OMD07797.1 hypothetical protein BJP47_30195 [Paenibacillus odorifer]OME46139.1 hypothetical protein BSK66_32315 [Paenibacillus odorifer]
METAKVVSFIHEDWKNFIVASYVIDGVELQVEFWTGDDICEFENDLMESMEDEINEEESAFECGEDINVDEPIFLCTFQDGRREITNSIAQVLERCLSMSQNGSGEIQSFELIECEDRQEPIHSELWHQVENGEIEVPNFTFYYSVELRTWVVPMEMCSLGGCDTNLIPFDDEQAAYDKAMELTRQGKEQQIGMPCHSCATEYYN